VHRLFAERDFLNDLYSAEKRNRFEYLIAYGIGSSVNSIVRPIVVHVVQV